MGANYKSKKRDFERKLRQRRAAELANGGDLGTVKLPPIRRKLRGTLQCAERPIEGSQIIVAMQDGEIVGLRENALLIKFDKSRVNKATLARLQKATFAIGKVKRPHLYLPLVDVSIEFAQTEQSRLSSPDDSTKVR